MGNLLSNETGGSQEHHHQLCLQESHGCHSCYPPSSLPSHMGSPLVPCLLLCLLPSLNPQTRATILTTTVHTRLRSDNAETKTGLFLNFGFELQFWACTGVQNATDGALGIAIGQGVTVAKERAVRWALMTLAGVSVLICPLQRRLSTPSSVSFLVYEMMENDTCLLRQNWGISK